MASPSLALVPPFLIEIKRVNSSLCYYMISVHFCTYYKLLLAQSGTTPLLLLALLLFKLPVVFTLRTLLPLPELGVRNHHRRNLQRGTSYNNYPIGLFIFLILCIVLYRTFANSESSASCALSVYRYV